MLNVLIFKKKLYLLINIIKLNYIKELNINFIKKIFIYININIIKIINIKLKINNIK